MTNGAMANPTHTQISTVLLSITYGKTHKPTPEISGTNFCCFLPYMKYATPTIPANTFTIKLVESKLTDFLRPDPRRSV